MFLTTNMYHRLFASQSDKITQNRNITEKITTQICQASHKHIHKRNIIIGYGYFGFFHYAIKFLRCMICCTKSSNIYTNAFPIL